MAWVFTLRGVANVWAAEGPDFEGRQLTGFSADDGRPLRVLGFAPDNEWVFFAKSSRFNPDHSALGSGPSKLYRVAWAGGDPQELAEAESAAVSPVEPKLAFVKEESEVWVVEPGEEAVKVESRVQIHPAGPSRYEKERNGKNGNTKPSVPHAFSSCTTSS